MEKMSGWEIKDFLQQQEMLTMKWKKFPADKHSD